MKTYTEMAESVLKRRDEYSTKRENAVRKFKSAAACISLCCLAAVISVAALRTPQIDYPDSLDTTAGTDIGTSNNHVHWADTTDWRLGDEILKSAENDTQMGVAMPMLVAYQGAIYGCLAEEYNENSQYALLETKIILRKNYSYPAYQVKGVSDSVAIIINGKLETYQKLFEVNAVIDGNPYRIVQPMMSGIDYSYGEIIQENEDFTVYQAINTQSGEVMEAKYVINILPLLKRELPNFFDGDENYGDAWWVAVPCYND